MTLDLAALETWNSENILRIVVGDVSDTTAGENLERCARGVACPEWGWAALGGAWT